MSAIQSQQETLEVPQTEGKQQPEKVSIMSSWLAGWTGMVREVWGVEEADMWVELRDIKDAVN